MILNLAYFLVSVIFINDPKNQVGGKLLEYHIEGQTYTTKVLHSFIGCYNLGLIIGFLLFNIDGTKNKINKLIYENYSNYFWKNKKMSKNSKELLNLEETFGDPGDSDSGTDSFSRIKTYNSTISYTNFQIPYYPLWFLNKILIWLKKKSFSTKILLILFCILFFIIEDFGFVLKLYYAKSFDIEITTSLKYCFMYEKIVFILVFFFLNLIMITLPNKGILRFLMNSRIVVFISRIGFLFTCTVYALTYFSFLLYDLKVKLYVPTIMVMSFANFLHIILECFFIFSLIELPLAVIIKKIVRIGRNKAKSDI
jgi:hypothetical protein